MNITEDAILCLEMQKKFKTDLKWFAFEVNRRSYLSLFLLVNKHKPWIESSYHGVITENTDAVLLDPPLVALDKDAPVPYAGKKARNEHFIGYWVYSTALHTRLS